MLVYLTLSTRYSYLMENIEVLYKTEIPQNIVNFLNMPNGVSKNVKYNKDGHFYRTMIVNIARAGKDVYCSYCDFKVIKSSKGNYFLRMMTKKGCSYKNGKFSMWYGDVLPMFPYLSLMFKTLKIDWIDPALHTYLTKGLMEKILSGTMTNPQEFCKHWLKYNRIKCSHKLFYKYCISTTPSDRVGFLQKSRLVENVDHLLELFITSKELYEKKTKDFEEEIRERKDLMSILNDMWTQAEILEKKINIRWSKKKMIDVHNKWSMEIMSHEMSDMVDETISYHSIPNLSHKKMKITLLDTKKKVFFEGKLMNHCLYTNYWPMIKNEKYLAFHIEYKDERATLGLSYKTVVVDTGEDFKITTETTWNQFYGPRNSQVSSKLRDITEEWFESVKNSFIIKDLELLSPQLTKEPYNNQWAEFV